MRQALAILGLLSMVAMTASANQNSEKPQSKQICTLKVTGMFCGACAKTVEKAAKKVDGVKDAKASQPKGSATITYDSTKTTPEAIAKAISANTPFKAEIPQNDRK